MGVNPREILEAIKQVSDPTFKGLDPKEQLAVLEQVLEARKSLARQPSLEEWSLKNPTEYLNNAVRAIVEEPQGVKNAVEMMTERQKIDDAQRAFKASERLRSANTYRKKAPDASAEAEVRGR